MKYLLLATILFSSVAHADPGLDQLKQSFTGVIQSATKEFDKAAKMKVAPLGKGTEISMAQCEELKNKIRGAYKIDPFEFIYEEGSTSSGMCGGQYGHLKNFLVKKDGKTNMGLSYVMVVQLEQREPMSAWASTSHYYIDADYRVVEIQGISYWPPTKEMVEYNITSTDADGDIYFSQWTKGYSIANTDIEGTHTMQKFIAADGSYPYPLVRRLVKHKTDSSRDYGILMLERADRMDWQGFELPITHAWGGGFYDYAGKYSRKPNFKSSLTIKYRGGKERCAYGSRKQDTDWVQFPAANAPYYECFNY